MYIVFKGGQGAGGSGGYYHASSCSFNNTLGHDIAGVAYAGAGSSEQGGTGVGSCPLLSSDGGG